MRLHRGVQGPGDPSRLDLAGDAEGHLHLNPAGYRAMASATSLNERSGSWRLQASVTARGPDAGKGTRSSRRPPRARGGRVARSLACNTTPWALAAVLPLVPLLPPSPAPVDPVEDELQAFEELLLERHRR